MKPSGKLSRVYLRPPLEGFNVENAVYRYICSEILNSLFTGSLEAEGGWQELIPSAILSV